ncbi:MAG: phage major capsid protein [Clostridia bacterium]|jgi:hypothetical protein
MADANTGLIVYSTLYADEATRQINRSSPTFSIMPKRQARSHKADYAIDIGGLTASTYEEGAEVGTANSDAQSGISLALANYESPFGVTDKAQAAARLNGVPGNVDQIGRQIVGASAAVAKQINGNIFNGTGVGSTETLIGLDTWIDTSNTVGGIDRTSATYWRAGLVATDEVTLTKKVLYSDLAEINNAGGVRPNLAICNPLVFTQIQALFDANVQYVADFSSVTGYPVLGSGSVPTIVINGCAFVEDPDGYVDTVNDLGTIYYLNSDHVWLEILPEQSPAVIPGFGDLSVPAAHGAAVYQYFEAGFTCKAVGRTAHAKKAVVSNMLQLCVDKPNCFGKRENISLSLS